MNPNNESNDENLAQSDNFLVWRSADEEGYTYHLEMGILSLHFTSEDWEEFVDVVQSVGE
ncbi:MAG TPA: hypothetical protein VLL52_07900 [Anaerolineae bacterium]|nr:hypothetical protein [Anaerolineae bacterium]